jgi:hypothetical protein
VSNPSIAWVVLVVDVAMLCTIVISQKSQIKSHQESLTQFAISEEQERERAKEEARARVLKDFEKGLGLGKAGSGIANASKKSETLESQAEQDASDSARGTKRKFEFDQGAVERLAKEAEDAALVTIEKEQVRGLLLQRDLRAIWLNLALNLGRGKKIEATVLLAANVST